MNAMNTVIDLTGADTDTNTYTDNDTYTAPATASAAPASPDSAPATASAAPDSAPATASAAPAAPDSSDEESFGRLLSEWSLKKLGLKAREQTHRTGDQSMMVAVMRFFLDVHPHVQPRFKKLLTRTLRELQAAGQQRQIDQADAWVKEAKEAMAANGGKKAAAAAFPSARPSAGASAGPSAGPKKVCLDKASQNTVAEYLRNAGLLAIAEDFLNGGK